MYAFAVERKSDFTDWNGSQHLHWCRDHFRNFDWNALGRELARCNLRIIAHQGTRVVGALFVNTSGCDAYIAVVGSLLRGVGRALFERLAECTSQTLRLRATRSALGFYLRLGFVFAPPFDPRLRWMGQQRVFAHDDFDRIRAALIASDWASQDASEVWMARAKSPRVTNLSSGSLRP